jgi:hypothetical protein
MVHVRHARAEPHLAAGGASSGELPRGWQGQDAHGRQSVRLAGRSRPGLDWITALRAPAIQALTAGVSVRLCSIGPSRWFPGQRADPGNRSAKTVANHCLGPFMALRQRTPAFRMAKQSSLMAASPVGKLPLVLMTLRNDRCRRSTALGTGMRISVPRFGRGRRDRGVWCGTEAPGARRCGQADAYDELRARVGSWPPLRPARLRCERDP